MLALITGSGLYKLDQTEVTLVKEHAIKTKFGKPSEVIRQLRYEGNDFFFLPRHGERHTLPPHRIPYRANMQALKELGVTHVVAHCVCGSLKKEIVPGSFMILDQFVDFTKRRDDFEPYHQFVHLPMGEPYCPHIRLQLKGVMEQLGYSYNPQGTIVVIDGPRFSTKAESLMYTAHGWEGINMTQYPECYLAREYGMNYGAFASVTDYNIGLQEEKEISPEGYQHVCDVFNENTEKSKRILLSVVRHTQQILQSPQLVSTLFKEFFRK